MEEIGRTVEPPQESGPPGFTNRLTRRRLLTASAAAAAGMVASSVLPRAAQAADDDPILIGQANTGTLETSLSVSLSGNVMRVENTQTGPSAGTGIKAVSNEGTALDVQGKAKFSRSGKATIPAGGTGKMVTGLTGLTSASLVLATLQGSAGPEVAIRYASVVDATSFRVALNKKAQTNVKFAWFVVN